MRTLIAVALLSLTPFAASALELKALRHDSLYACQGGTLSHVALREQAAPCCEDRIRCAQLLSTQGMIRSRTRPRA